MERLAFNGWEDSIRLTNGSIEVVIPTVMGIRIARFGFCGEANLFAEIAGEQGGRGEPDWHLRGGHRFWIAPEAKPMTYECDNDPVAVAEIPHGVRVTQPLGALSHCRKEVELAIVPDRDAITVHHRLTYCGSDPVTVAPWALSVLAPGGMAIIPLPDKIAHTERLLHNQQWSIWGYTDFADPRWTLGSRFVFFRQDQTRGPAKLGMAHREGWVAYQRQDAVFVKHFGFDETAYYPDGGVNFETFSNEDFLELESLGGLVTLQPGTTTTHTETWMLLRWPEPVQDEAGAARLAHAILAARG